MSRYTPSSAILSLGDGFFDAVTPAAFPLHTLRFRNQRWAARVGLADLDADAWTRHFATFEALDDGLASPVALRYHGHQFQSYNPGLGDGRGFLFAQLADDDGRLLDLGTKGSGRTPWSRGGDGRLTLKGGVREVLATEMLEALGVYTSKSFSLFETGERLMRGDEPSPTRSSVLVRLGHSHLRFGTFQRLSYEHDEVRLRRLVEHIAVHYFADATAGANDLPTAVLRLIVHKTAALCASWIVAGFVHGVLNTDNMNINGESFDYGPWRFIPRYDPGFVAAYFDHSGFYAFGRQPDAVAWNLSRLAECIRSLSPTAPFGTILSEFAPVFNASMQAKLVSRLGVEPGGVEMDSALVERVYTFLGESGVDYDRFFFDWFGGGASQSRAFAGPMKAAYASPAFAPVRELFELYAPTDATRLSHPYFASDGPCSMLIDEVEALWTPIAERDDWSLFEAKIAAVREMGEAVGLAPSTRASSSLKP